MDISFGNNSKETETFNGYSSTWPDGVYVPDAEANEYILVYKGFSIFLTDTGHVEEDEDSWSIFWTRIAYDPTIKSLAFVGSRL